MITAVSDPILLTNAQGKLLMGNTRAEQLLAWSEDTSEGRRHALELNNLHFSSALAGASVGDFGPREVILVDPEDGSDLLFELLTTPLEAERGQSAFVSVLRNVTDLGRATREIEDNYKRLRAAEAQARAVLHACSGGANQAQNRCVLPESAAVQDEPPHARRRLSASGRPGDRQAVQSEGQPPTTTANDETVTAGFHAHRAMAHE